MQERYFALLDILGFSALVRQIAREPELYEAIVHMFNDVRFRIPPGLREGDAQFRAQNFSDTIVFSSAATPVGLWHLLLSIDALAFSLLQRGVFIRGGVSKGPLHHDDFMLFGEAVLEAYYLESDVAKYPRVVLSRLVFVDAERFAREEEWARVYFDSRLIRADGGPAFVHIFCEMEALKRGFRSGSAPGSDQHPLIQTGQLIAATILRKLDEAMDRPAHFEKIRWMADYWNRTVCAGRHLDDRWLQPISIPGDLENRPGTRLPFRHV